jgi:hypothetical protein
MHRQSDIFVSLLLIMAVGIVAVGYATDYDETEQLIKNLLAEEAPVRR